MIINNSSIKMLDRQTNLGKDWKTGVSLHCHTLYSKEMMDFLPYYASKIPIVSYIWQRECRRYFEREGHEPNFSSGYWEPPLTGPQVYASETTQINRSGLSSIVSITDHDSIAANIQLNAEIDNSRAPISMEWTVPFKHAYFHIGIHNLPVDSADDLSKILLDYTFAGGEPDSKRLHEIYGVLNEIPEVLIVFNHPVWDIEMIGQAPHEALLKLFLAEFGKWIHALEVNGFRPWVENQATIEIAELHGFPLISGGDRHCLHTNTIINVTGAETFAEFAEEIRVGGHSTIAIMPEYREPLASRQIQSMAQILGYYPDFPEGRQKWYERVYFDAGDETGVRSLASHWNGLEPAWHSWAIGILSMLSHRGFYAALRLLDDDGDGFMKRSTPRQPLSILGQNPLVAER